MPAPKLLAGLPKPVLFGLYGAIGGLIGAVFFGEPAWRILKPPAVVLTAQVAISAPSAVTVYPGTENAFVVRIARQQFEGGVVVAFNQVPAGVSIAPVTIPAGKNEGEVHVVAAEGTPLATSKVALSAASEDGSLTAATSMDVEVAPVPPPPPALAVAIPANLTLYKRLRIGESTSVVNSTLRS